MINKKPNLDLTGCRVSPIGLQDARKITVAKHYMGTWPQGAKVAFGLFKKSKCVGVMVAGYAPTTERPRTATLVTMTTSTLIDRVILYLRGL